MAKKKDNIEGRIEKARQENRTLAFEYLNVNFNDTSSDYKKGFPEGVKFCKEFPNAGQELIRYFEIARKDP